MGDLPKRCRSCFHRRWNSVSGCSTTCQWRLSASRDVYFSRKHSLKHHFCISWRCSNSNNLQIVGNRLKNTGWRVHTMTSAAVLTPPSACRRPSARLLVADTVSA